MHKEIEAKFLNISIPALQARITDSWWILEQPKTLFKRVVFHDPRWDVSSYLRVRDEGNKVTMTYKQVENKDLLEWVRESEIEVSDFDKTKEILLHMWFSQKAYQETYRETREIYDSQVTIDERPWLQPFIEIEADSEDKVIHCATSLWFTMSKAVYWSVSEVYIIELGLSATEINSLPIITFDNPPQKKQLQD